MKKLSSIVKSGKRNSQVGDLVNRCNEKALINPSSNSFASLPDYIFKLPIARSTTNFTAQSEDKNVKQLTEMM